MVAFLLEVSDKEPWFGTSGLSVYRQGLWHSLYAATASGSLPYSFFLCFLFCFMLYLKLKTQLCETQSFKSPAGNII